MIFERLTDGAFWKTVRTDARYEALLQQTNALWERLRYEEIPVLSYEDRMLYYKTGDRKRFETPYFRRRNSLSVAALLALVYPEREEYIDYTQRMLWAICDEYSWAVPAHTKGMPESDVGEIDLFNAETAFAVTEISHVLSDRIDDAVRTRVAQEVRRRIFDTFSTRISWYETLDSNWAAVCGGNVGGAMMYLCPEMFDRYLPRFLDTMNRFLGGFSEEGICMEGTSYWGYGFSNFTWFSDMLFAYTKGRVDLFSDARARCVASYMQKSFLKGNTTVSFSDGTRYGKTIDSLQYFLSLKYPEEVHCLPCEVSLLISGNVLWMNLSRAFVYAPPTEAVRRLPSVSWDFPMSGQMIVNEARYSLFAKAGHNQEQHNHNDVGSFILSTENGQIFCDLGSGLYTRQYFQSKMTERYAILCNSSLGHSVPIVNGCVQQAGRKYEGSIAHRENRILIEMAKAYGEGVIDSLCRELRHECDRVVLTDRYADFKSLTERFVTTAKPSVSERFVRVKDVMLSFDPAITSPRVKEEIHLTHKGDGETVYCIDFDIPAGTKEASFVFSVD